MKPFLILPIILILLVSGCAQQQIETAPLSNMKLTSPAFSNNGSIPSKYTCDGENVNPPLKIEAAPSGTKSLVLIMDDPDALAVAGKVWDHWVVFNMDPQTDEIPEAAAFTPSPIGKSLTDVVGVLGKNTAGSLSYGGPCPPDKEHRYFFKLYALDTQLNLKEGSTKPEVENAMKGHILGQAELVGKYNRIK